MSDEEKSIDEVEPEDLPGVQEQKVAKKTFGGVGADEEGDKPKKLELRENDAFRMAGKNMRHYVAHSEYGVVFSLCGIRTVVGSIEVGAPGDGGEVVECNKCLYHLKREAAK